MSFYVNVQWSHRFISTESIFEHCRTHPLHQATQLYYTNYVTPPSILDTWPDNERVCVFVCVCLCECVCLHLSLCRCVSVLWLPWLALLPQQWRGNVVSSSQNSPSAFRPLTLSPLNKNARVSECQFYPMDGYFSTGSDLRLLWL